MTLHGVVVTAALAASSRGKAIRLVRAKAHEGGAKALPEIPRKRELRQRCQRLDQQLAPWEDNTHARGTPCRETKRFKR
jgi:hypothetical protein